MTATTRGAAVLAGIPVSALAGALLGAEELVLLAIALCALLLCSLVQVSYRARTGRSAQDEAGGADGASDRAGPAAQSAWLLGAELPVSDAAVGRALTFGVTVTSPDGAGSVPLWLEDPVRAWRPVQRARRRVDRAAVPRQSLPSPATVVRVPPMGAGGTVSFSFPAPTLRRGAFTLSSLRLWCPDSLGLLARVVAEGPSATITVHPSPVSVELHDDLLYGEQGAELPPGTPLAPNRSDGFGEFSGLRPYVPGDRLRLLYWPALARTGELMVQEFEDAGSHRVQVVADVRPMIGPSGCESVLATAAAVGLQALEAGSVVELSTTDGERIAIGPGPYGAIGLLRAVACIELVTPPSRRRSSRKQGRGVAGEAESDAPALHPTSGRQLVVTTRRGADAMPATLGLADLVIAP